MGYVEEVLADNPVLFWPLHDHAQTVFARDFAPTYMQGSLNNGPTFATSGPYADGTAVQFDGTNDYISRSDSGELRLTDAFAIEFWVNGSNLSATDRYIASKRNNYAVLFGYVSGTIEFYAEGFTGTAPRTGTGLTLASGWHHVVYRKTLGGEWVSLLDGTVQLNTTRTFTLTTSTNPFHLGASLTGNFFPGKVAGFAIYKDDVPSVARFQAHYAATDFVEEPTAGLVPFSASGWSYKIGAAGLESGFEAPAFDVSSWSTGAAPFGNGASSPGTSHTEIRTHWTTTGSPTEVVARRSLGTISGRFRLTAEVDDNVQLWHNGSAVHTESTAIGASNIRRIEVELVGSGANVVAIRARDLGGSGANGSFLDAEVVLLPVTRRPVVGFIGFR